MNKALDTMLGPPDELLEETLDQMAAELDRLLLDGAFKEAENYMLEFAALEPSMTDEYMSKALLILMLAWPLQDSPALDSIYAQVRETLEVAGEEVEPYLTGLHRRTT